MAEAEPNAGDATGDFIRAALEGGKRDVPLTVNPALRSLQAVLRRGQPGKLELGFGAGPQTVQGNGVVGGGTIANMLDCAIAVAVLSALPKGSTCATVSLTVNMLRGAQAGDFTAAAAIDRVGRRIAFGQAQLFDAEKNLVATATSSLAVIRS